MKLISERDKIVRIDALTLADESFMVVKTRKFKWDKGLDFRSKIVLMILISLLMTSIY